MKKKKLKKRIEKLEENLKKIGEIYPVIKKDIDSDMDARRFEIKDVNEKILFLKTKVDVLWEWLNRSGIDFSEWKEAQTYNKTLYSKRDCGTCKWQDLPSDVGPCMGCSYEDKKMYSPKEAPNGN